MTGFSGKCGIGWTLHFEFESKTRSEGGRFARHDRGN